MPVTDPVTQFRSDRVTELGALVNACADESREIDTEYPAIIARMREIHFFAEDLSAMTTHLRDIALRNNLLYWARRSPTAALDDLPWGRVNAAAEQLLNEPQLYQRDWSAGPIDLQYREVITGWIDLGDCARRARADSARSDYIDDVQLFVGATNVLRFGAVEIFKALKWRGEHLIEDIFQTILERPDVNLDMFPAALTYFGSEGVMVLNQLATENQGLYEALLRFADQGLFDDENRIETPAAGPAPAAGPPTASPTAGTGVAVQGRSIPSMAKGSNLSLSQRVAHLGSVVVTLGWAERSATGATFDLDASAIACGQDKRVISDEYFVFYNNKSSPEGTIVHSGDNRTGGGSGEVINVDLAATPEPITNVYFSVSIHESDHSGTTFGQVRDAFINVADAATGADLARFDLTEDASTETAMVFGELYRRGAEWKFRAIGQGYASGLAGIARDYGIDV